MDFFSHWSLLSSVVIWTFRSWNSIIPHSTPIITSPHFTQCRFSITYRRFSKEPLIPKASAEKGRFLEISCIMPWFPCLLAVHSFLDDFLELKIYEMYFIKCLTLFHSCIAIIYIRIVCVMVRLLNCSCLILWRFYNISSKLILCNDNNLIQDTQLDVEATHM